MHNWYYKILDHLPAVPQELIDKAYNSIDTQLDSMPSGHWNKISTIKILVDGVEKTNAPMLAYSLNNEMQSWVHENITDRDITNVRISVSNSDETKDTNGAHCDLSRDYALIYLLENGGPNHKTVFYKERDKLLWRNKGERCDDYSLLEEIDSIAIPLKTWVLLTTTVLHGVVNIPKQRVAIQVGLTNCKSLGIND
jgi:hypothetical protein